MKRPKFSIVVLLVFALIFVIAGIYLIFQMFAAEIEPVSVISPTGKTAQRVWGSSRYETAAFVSKSNTSVTQGGTVIIVNGLNWPDATAASSLAGAYNAPILLTSVDSLPEETRKELARLRPAKIFIIGGSSAVNQTVEASIKSLVPGAVFTRIAGATRYQTAVKIAEAVNTKLGTIPEGKAFIVSGANFADSLTVGAIAAYKKYPILFADSSLGAETERALRDLNITKTYVVGGEKAVTPAVMSILPSPERISGTSRYLTSIAFAKWAVANVPGVSYYNLGLAPGADFPDALSAGVRLASMTKPGILLLSESAGTTEVNNFIGTIKGQINNIYLFGGPETLSDSLYAKAMGYVGISHDSFFASLQSLLDYQILKFPILRGQTVVIDNTIGYAGISLLSSAVIKINQSYKGVAASPQAYWTADQKQRVITHETWHLIDWRDNGKIDWNENIPPRIDATIYESWGL